MRKPPSILTKRFINLTLETAKLNLQQDGQLTPIIFSRIDTLKGIALLPVEFPEYSHESKVKRIVLYGEAIRQKTGGKILEAIFLSDTFYIKAKEKDAENLSLPVHDNPLRQEAIVLVGRDSTGDKCISAMAGYNRKGGKIVFDTKPKINLLHTGTSGILDYFFSYNSGRLADLSNEIALTKKRNEKYETN